MSGEIINKEKIPGRTMNIVAITLSIIGSITGIIALGAVILFGGIGRIEERPVMENQKGMMEGEQINQNMQTQQMEMMEENEMTTVE